jgi:hypothetical protein
MPLPAQLPSTGVDVIKKSIVWMPRLQWLSFFKTAVIVLTLFLTCSLHAQQFPFDLWHEGKLVLESRDTLKGKLKYNMQNDLLQLQANGHLETYTARKIIYFEIFDQTVKRYREFYCLPYANSGQYKTPIFFELLEEGKMTLLARELLEYKTYSSYYYYGSYTRLVLVNKYFFLKEDGTINDFTGKKNDLLALMGAHENDVQRFIKENKLSFDKKYDIARAVEYYNSFFK